MKKIQGLFRLVRFELPFSAGICVVMGQLLALGECASVYETVNGFLSVFCVSASILVLNDYFDVETDRINAPGRPIPSNIVTPREALALSAGLFVIGLVLGSMVNIISLLTIILLSIIGFLYNRIFKKTGLPGNVMVSVSVGMTFIYGGITVGLPFHKMTWFFGIIGALIDLGEEIAADAMDVEGDLLIHSHSLAITYGKQTAIRISGCIFLCVVVLTFVPFVLQWFPVMYLIPIIIMDSAVAYPALKLVKSDKQEGRKYIRWIYLGATSGVMVFILMRFVEGLK